MAPCNLSAMILVVGVSSCVSAYVPKYNLQCLDSSKVQSVIIVIEDYVCDIPPTGGKAFSHITTNMTISMEFRPGSLLNFRVLLIYLSHSLVTLICRSISGTCSASAVLLRVDIPGILLLRFSNSLYMYNVSTYIPHLW